MAISRDGRTNSLDEYNARRMNLMYNEAEVDLILQRVLAESLLSSGGTAANAIQTLTTATTPTRQVANFEANNEENTLRAILELSKKEDEERRRREIEEEEELRKILELSLHEK